MAVPGVRGRTFSQVEPEGPLFKKTKFSQDLDDLYDTIIDSDGDDGAI